MKGGRVLAVAVVWSASLVGVGLWAERMANLAKAAKAELAAKRSDA
jgi:type IV secretory pathway TrbD component